MCVCVCVCVRALARVRVCVCVCVRVCVSDSQLYVLFVDLKKASASLPFHPLLECPHENGCPAQNVRSYPFFASWNASACSYFWCCN